MAQILDSISSKKKFVESFTQQNKQLHMRDDDFLKPVKTKREIKIEIIEDGTTLHSRKVAVNDYATLRKLQKFMNLPEQREARSASETDEVPEWAKLALASTNPNSKRKFEYY